MDLVEIFVRLLLVTVKKRVYPFEDNRRRPDCHTFYWVSSGTGELTIEKHRYEMKNGRLFYFKPGIQLLYRVDQEGSPLCVTMVQFDAARLRYLREGWQPLESIAEFKIPLVRDYEGTSKRTMSAIFEELVHYWAPDNNLNDLSGRDLLLQLIIRLLRSEHTPEQGETLAIVCKIRDTIATNLANAELSIAVLAAEHQISASNLRKWFVREYGAPPKVYLLHLRMEQASRHLIHTSSTVKAVAEACGFKDEYHFSKTFKKHYGIAPVLYRRKHSSES